jgi:hypothetical protein
MTQEYYERQEVKTRFMKAVELVVDKPQSWVAREERRIVDDKNTITYRMEITKIIKPNTTNV